MKTTGNRYENEPPYAGFWKRFAASIIDGIVLTIGVFVISIAFTGGSRDPLELTAVSTIIDPIIAWIYFTVWESSPTQGTLGKLALGLRVTDLEGNRIGFGRATGRFFGKIVSSLIVLIGFIMIAFTQKKQGLHDVLAGCLVVKT